MIIRKILFLLVFSSLLLAQGFEGFVKYKLESEGETTYMKYYSKGKDVRMVPEMESMPMQGAILFKDGKTYVIMDQQKMYMEFNMDKFDMQQSDPSEKAEEGDFKAPQKTGETKDILGYTAEKWVFEDDEYTSEVWVAEGLGDFNMMTSPMGKENMPDWYSDLTNGGFFPMLVVAKDASGKTVGKMEVVEINEESLSSDMFEIPSSYQKMSMPGGMPGGGY